MNEMKIECSNSLIQQKMLEMVELLVDNGAFFHPDVVIKEIEGSISIETNENCSLRKGAKVMEYNKDLLVPLKDIKLSLNGNDFDVEFISAELTEYQKNITKLHFEIYNLTNKIELHQQWDPWISNAADKDFIYMLSYLNGNEEAAERRTASVKSTLSSEELINSFIGTRKINLPYRGQGALFLMPIIDYLNHHADAKGYDSNNDNLTIYLSKSNQQTNECYVCYNSMDVVTSLFNYGFVDEQSELVKSQACTLTLPIGKIEISNNSKIGRLTQSFEPKYKVVGKHLPDIYEVKRGKISVSHITIPCAKSQKRHLRLILSFILGAWVQQKQLSSMQISEYVTELERQIIELNISFYQKYLTKVEYYYASTKNNKWLMLINLAKHQINNLQQHQLVEMA